METATLEYKIKQLSPRHKEEVERVIEQLLNEEKPTTKKKFKFDWEGALHDMKNQYTSVELQHKALEWWGD
ncbi:MAG: DUF2281 domain-containing protein [Bacteroidota bacterium]